jgi:hypothetical protein
MVDRLYRFFSVCALALWMGGFTFYALVVIPTGNRVLDGIEQGLVTQQVSHWINLIGAVSLAILLPRASQSWRLGITWLVMAAAQGALFWLHPRLDALIDPAQRTVASDVGFYQWHRAYLAAITIQWLAAVAHLWSLLPSNAPKRRSDPQPHDLRKKNMAC